MRPMKDIINGVIEAIISLIDLIFNAIFCKTTCPYLFSIFDFGFKFDFCVSFLDELSMLCLISESVYLSVLAVSSPTKVNPNTTKRSERY
ncbi:MAG: hypothetical protein GF364_17270 [Candidatus Lokiarchaeota archaeon]|nr:hypothetical protein [Candidatus Lokiarchaeota archaeon]